MRIIQKVIIIIYCAIIMAICLFVPLIHYQSIILQVIAITAFFTIVFILTLRPKN